MTSPNNLVHACMYDVSIYCTNLSEKTISYKKKKKVKRLFNSTQEAIYIERERGLTLDSARVEP
jgi:hypothetical protein